jgi:general secretion pathway protein M
MRLILSRMPALDAALLRFDAWWSGLTMRERVMVSVLATFAALLILVFGVVKPLQSARAQALADIRTYETLTARVRAAGTLGATQPARRQGAPAQIVATSATGFGLVAAPQPIAGGVRVMLADASYDSLMAWLADLGATSNLRVRRLQLTRGPAAGRVAATVDFAS